MPRIRYLKPDFFDDERLCSLKPLSRLLFAGMWCWADREGRLEDSPARLKKNILGYDNCRVEPLLAELAEGGHIIRYEVKGRCYIQVRHFLRHQRPHVKEVPSTYPAPTQGSAEHLPDPPGMGNGEWGTGMGNGDGEPPPPLQSLYWRHFGHEPTKQQQDELGTFIALHGQPCVDWVLTEVGGAAIEKRTWRNARFKFGDCETLGHGPERKPHAAPVRTHQGHSPAAGRSGEVRRGEPRF